MTQLAGTRGYGVNQWRTGCIRTGAPVVAGPVPVMWVPMYQLKRAGRRTKKAATAHNTVC